MATFVETEQVPHEGHSGCVPPSDALLSGNPWCLVKAGWLRPEVKPTGGRPAYRWTVNPKLLGPAEIPEIPEIPERGVVR
jgi:hypothetical protein